MRQFWTAFLLMVAVFSSAPVFSAEKLQVVASFSILGDMARIIGGERIAVTVLVGPEADAHVFEPAPRDVKRMAAAKLVILNGLGFEGWMERLVKASGGKPRLVIASEGVTPLHEKDESGREKIDPHAWQDVTNAKRYVANIAAALKLADPEGAAFYTANANQYLLALDALDAGIRAMVAGFPVDRRKIVTSHDAFGYFERAYGIAMIAPQGVSTETEASAKDVARIIRQIKDDAIPAVFLENVTDPRLINQIARESSTKVGGRLYSDALSQESGPAGTYIAMMQNNIRELKKALLPQ